MKSTKQAPLQINNKILFEFQDRKGIKNKSDTDTTTLTITLTGTGIMLGGAKKKD